MPAQPPLSSKSQADEVRLQKERTIDRLAELARSDIEPGKFFAEILSSALQSLSSTRAAFWRPSIEGPWQLAGEIPPGVSPDSRYIEQQQALLAEVSAGDTPRIINAHEDLRGLSSNGSITERIRVFIPIRHADQIDGILETAHESVESGLLPADTIHFLAMLCEITGDFLGQRELQQLRRMRIQWQKWDQFSQQLWQTLELNSVCAAISNDGRLLAECDRVSVLIRRGGAYQVASVSGVERVEPRSSSTRSLISVAGLVARRGQSVWRELSTSDTEIEYDPAQDAIIQRHLSDSGASAVGVVPIKGTNEGVDRTPPVAVVVFDQFHPKVDLTTFQSLGETLVNRSSSTLRAALEFNEIPWLPLWQRIRRLPRMVRRPSTLFVLAILFIVIMALILIPAELTVSGTAELWPARRREVFASTSGIVDEILVAHGHDVGQGQPLIVLRDPLLESDSPRIIGEIATVSERLKGVQAARFTGGNTTDAVSRTRQLTADEEELKERLRTLERQRQLIEERSAALTLRSPIAGKVLTWDVAQHLSARPVERGQSLLTIGDTAGPWVVEVRVADKDVGHLLRARKATSRDLDVDLMLAAEPGRTIRGQIREMSLSSESDEGSQSHVRVVVTFDRNELEQPRAGATVLPRIHCGRKPLGYVWLRDLIDAIRTRLLF